MSKRPEWLDESKIVSAIFALDHEHPAYGGHVVDLGDGTCRIAVPILLPPLKFGDRVDLFWNPCDPFSRPFIGYRVYKDGEVPGTHKGKRRKPTKKEIAEHKKDDRERTKRECKRIEEEHESRGALTHALSDLIDLKMKYLDLLELAEKGGVVVPPECGVVVPPELAGFRVAGARRSKQPATIQGSRGRTCSAKTPSAERRRHRRPSTR